MSDKMIFIAFVMQQSDWGTQLLRYAFEHPIVEYYGEPEEQAKLKAYFKKHHYTHYEPLIVEQADFIDFTPYEREAPEWDGHTPQEAAKRIARLTKQEEQ